jgi:hypothetical protein
LTEIIKYVDFGPDAVRLLKIWMWLQRNREGAGGRGSAMLTFALVIPVLLAI